MTQLEMERELSALTGETLGEIRRRGFSLVEVESEPLSIDWDEVQQVEPLRHKPRRRPVRRHQAA